MAVTSRRAAHDPAPGRRRPGAATVAFAAAVALVGVGALWLRAWLLAHAAIDSDQAVVGLMADAILRGHQSAFYWGQAYGGAEPYVVAAMFAVLGHSAYVLDLTASALSLASAGVVYLLGVRVLRRRGVAAAAACLAWAWPWAALRQSTMELGFRQVTVLAGLSAVLVAHLAAYGRVPGPRGPDAAAGGWPLWAALGLVAGVGWWSSPEIAYFGVAVLPLAAVGLARARGLRRRLGRAGAAIGGFGAGAGAWLAANVRSGFASLHSAGVGSVPHGSYASRLGTFFTHMGPLMLGLRQPTTGSWTVAPAFGVAGSLLVGALGLGAAALLVARGPAGAWALALFVVAFPFVYAALPPTSYWQDGRYGVFLPPVLALVVAGGGVLAAGALRRPRLAPAVAAAAVVLAGLSTLYGFDRAFPPASRPGVLRLSPAANPGALTVGKDLTAHHLTRVVGSYWSAYDLDLLTPAVTATPIAPVRDPADWEAVMRARPVAWLFIGPTAGDRRAADAAWGNLTEPLTMPLDRFTAVLRGDHIAYRQVRCGFMVAVVPRGVTGAAVTAKLL